MNKTFTQIEDIKNWLDSHKIKDYSINNDLSVDVRSMVDLSNSNLEFIPVKFSNVFNHFYIDHNSLTSFENFPLLVSGEFSCTSNKFTSLQNSPAVLLTFNANYNPIVSLAGIKEFGEELHLSHPEHQKIIGLEGLYSGNKLILTYEQIQKINLHEEISQNLNTEDNKKDVSKRNKI